MKTTTYKVTVNETSETKSFGTIEEARQWALAVRSTLEMWGGDVTFRCEKTTTEDVTL